MLDKIVDRLLAEHGKHVVELEEEMLALRALRTGGGKKGEDARRRLRHPRSKTVYPEAAAEAIKRDLHEKRRTLVEHVAAAVPLALDIELLEREEKHLNELLADIDVGKTELKKARFWPGAAKFAVLLFDRYGIQHTYFAMLTDNEIATIAGIILRRQAQCLKNAAMPSAKVVT